MTMLRGFLLATAAGIAGMLGSPGESLAVPLQLNPSAPNTGAAGGAALDPTTGAFFTTSSHTGFTADLHILGTPTTPGVVGFSEAGSFLIHDFEPPDPPTTNSNVTHNYNIFATFTITGVGTWAAAPGLFLVSQTGLAVTVNLFGSPGSQATTGLAFTTPTNESGFNGLTNPGVGNFLLGTASLVTGALGNFADAVGCFPTCTNSPATTNFNAGLDFTPATGTTGPTGFFENVAALGHISIGSQAGGAAGGSPNTFEFVNPDGTTDFITIVNNSGGSGSDPAGGGSLTYALIVPEPASLSLLGVSLLGLATALRRRKRVAR